LQELLQSAKLVSFYSNEAIFPESSQLGYFDKSMFVAHVQGNALAAGHYIL
jgi:hypothetical protein